MSWPTSCVRWPTRWTVAGSSPSPRASPSARQSATSNRPEGQAGSPSPAFGSLDGIFQFTVDATANAENALLPRYWDHEHDAMQQDWSQEDMWCNPPYSRPAPFLAKATTAHLAVVLLWADCLTTH